MMTQLNKTINQPLLTNQSAVDWFNTLKHKCSVMRTILTTLLLFGFSMTAQAVATTTTLTTSVTSAVVGVNVTLTASVAGLTPTGNVVFKDGTTTIGTVATTGTTATRTAALVTTFSTVGAHSITAVYAGDADDTTSTSTAKTVTATIKATTNTLTVSPTSAVVNATSVALTATVVGYTPTGTVTFKDGTTTIGTATLSGTGTTATATLNTTFSTAASHSITAVYAGDANDATSTATAKTVTVTKAVTTTTLTNSVSTAAAGQSVTLTATSTGFNPTGTVTFKDGTTTLGTGTLSGTGNSRTATFNAIFSTVASHSITAVYAGDTNNNTSTSAASVVAVTIASSSTVLTAPATAQLNQSIVLTATVTGYTPTGIVTFKEGATTLGTATLAGAGTTTKTATLSKSFTTLGVHSITAVTTGDANDATSTSAAINITITTVATTTTLTTNPTSANLGQNVTFTASITGLTPTGNVVFKDGTTTLGTVATTGTTATRTAVFTTSFNTVGAHSITAEYAGDADDAASTSAVTNLAITTPTTSVLSANPSVAVVNTNVVLTANVTGIAPTGNVTFKDGATTLGTGTLTSTGATTATATLTTSFSSVGIHNLTAVYGGDTSNLTSTTTAINLNVTAVPTVSITAPVNNANYAAPANLTLIANVTDNATITNVKFYDGATLLGTATQQGATSNYSYNWNNVPQGSYTISAVASTNNATTVTSSPVQISVAAAAAQVYYIHTDQLDTPRLITNSANAKVWEWNNDDPFANNVPNDDPNSTGNHFEYNPRLSGQYYDKETGLFYNWNRFYNPATGRYDQSDLIGLAAGVNTYAYVENDPLNSVDEEGLASSKQRRTIKRNTPPKLQPSQNSEIKNALDNLNDILDTPDPGEGLMCLEITCTGINNCGYKYSYTINSFMASVGASLYSRADSVSRYGEGCICTKRRSISE